MTKYVLIVNEILIKHIMIMSCHVMSCPFLAMLLYLCCIQIPFPCLEFLKRRKMRREEERERRWRGLTDSTLAKRAKSYHGQDSREFLPTTQCSLLSSTSITPLGVNCSFPPSLTDYPDNSCLGKYPVSSQEER